MKRRMRTAKRWLGFLLSMLLVVEASGMQVLAEESANFQGPWIGHTASNRRYIFTDTNKRLGNLKKL